MFCLSTTNVAGAPSISRLETIDSDGTSSLNTIESDSNVDATSRVGGTLEVMIAEDDELLPVVMLNNNNNNNVKKQSQHDEQNNDDNTNDNAKQISSGFDRFQSMFQRLSGVHDTKIAIPLVLPIEAVNSDIINRRIIFTAPQIGDTNTDFKPE